ncbi:SFT2-domain-containing protein [Nadsonia fulvescens var. elongata DSM 6958]|uniref:Protein transport protein SFT2 n=1 Tax=Nadsonia fulvescens var. elongata DSM 6958 TaxID=857566 RepID=A0A1E3PEC8_9ASCO|nr:SFT2-domain-containing protein [Nadsonia fulvescens var. elongata DSM 6958]
MSNNSESAFKTHLNFFRSTGGSSSGTSAPITGSGLPQESFLSGLNPFGGQNSYVRLPLWERNETATETVVEEPAWFTLSQWDRLIVFGVCLIASVACFALCFLILPILALKPRKFALLWTLGSLLFVISFGVLQGPMAYLSHLLSPNRLPFTISFFGSIVATLVFSVGWKNTILTIIACVIQVIAALWYAVSYFPMGAQSLKFASRVGARQVSSWINS